MKDTASNTNPALDKLNREVAAIINSDMWKAALNMRSRLHSYSFNNILLVLMQRPDATMLAGFRKWQEFDRFVKRGEKGIAILAPLLKTVTDEQTGEKRKVLYGYKTVYVFDVTQTEGAPIPEQVKPKLLTGDDDAARAALAGMATLAASERITIDPTPLALLGGAYGDWYPPAKRIRIGLELPAKHAAAVLAHELGHALLGHERTEDYDYALGELEAETTAYLVMSALGLPTDEAAFAYLAHYTQTPEQFAKLLQAGARATKVADRIVKALTGAGDTPAPEAVAA